jgi:hypothetical protein
LSCWGDSDDLQEAQFPGRQDRLRLIFSNTR